VASAADRLRWLELLSYVQALVYPDRERPEREGLRELIVASVATDEHGQEVRAMGQSIADSYREEGRNEEQVRSRQDVLLVLLRERFDSVPKAVECTIRAAADVGQLTTWLRRVVSADSLDEIGIRGEC
jgi:hypothetical protein